VAKAEATIKRPIRWPIVVALAVVAMGLVVTLVITAAEAQVRPTARGGKDNIFVVAGQLSDRTYGLYLVDYDNKTICVYQFLDNPRKLRLMATRTYAFDVRLDEYNTEPGPREIKQLVDNQKRLDK
jgi:hypothetical protein